MSHRGNRRTATRLIRQQVAAETRRRRSLRISAIATGVLLLLSIGAYTVYANTKESAHRVPQHANAAGTGFTTGGGQVTVEVYQDYLCPACAAFHQEAHDRLQKMAEDNEITLTMYPIAILDRLSSNRYSTRAAAATACAADAGEFTTLSDALYGNQPAEGGAGHSDEQLVTIGSGLGLNATFATCVRDSTYATWPRFTTEQASSRGVTGTPTIYVHGKKVVPQNGQSMAAAVFTAIADANT